MAAAPIAAPARRRPEPRTAPRREAAPRPRLRALPEGYLTPAARRRRARRVGIAAVAIVVTGLFVTVAMHVVLTQNQFRLEQLEAEADDAQARFERLRLEVAELESPERIVAAAQERLGMVPPAGVTYLSPTGVAGNEASVYRDGDVPRSSSSQPVTGEWGEAKRHLDAAP